MNLSKSRTNEKHTTHGYMWPVSCFFHCFRKALKNHLIELKNMLFFSLVPLLARYIRVRNASDYIWNSFEYLPASRRWRWGSWCPGWAQSPPCSTCRRRWPAPLCCPHSCRGPSQSSSQPLYPAVSLFLAAAENPTSLVWIYIYFSKNPTFLGNLNLYLHDQIDIF